jgi:hypothetical protein
MTRNELIKRFPHATESFLQANADDPGLRAVQPQPVERLPLDPHPSGEETRWYDAARRFEIVLTVHSIRPCDWDGYDIKALQDFLIRAGILPDDGWKTLSGRVVSCKAATKDEEKTTIEITAFIP